VRTRSTEPSAVDNVTAVVGDTKQIRDERQKRSLRRSGWLPQRVTRRRSRQENRIILSQSV
jgi:hypothetical protein